MFLFIQIQLHDHPSVFGVAKILFAIAAKLSVRLCHISYTGRSFVYCLLFTDRFTKRLYSSGLFVGACAIAFLLWK